MSTKFKTILLTVVATGFIASSTSIFAAKATVPGVIDPCEQLWLVNDHNNEFLPPNAGGECIDIPVNLKKVKVLFNIDAPVINTSDTSPAYPDGSAVALKHMYMLGTVMQHRIEIGEMVPQDVAIVGIMHGGAMRSKWAFKTSPVAFWIDKILSLKNGTNCDAGTFCPAINIQLEACGVTLKGMQKKGATLGNGQPLDERAMYSSPAGKVYLNQGAVGRMIELQQSGFVYLQEE